MFSNLRRTHEYGTSPLSKQLSFYFLASCRKKIIPWELIKLGKLPQQRPRVLLPGEIPQNTHTNEKGTVYVEATPAKVL
jgi:hypothetical protein